VIKFEIRKIRKKQRERERERHEELQWADLVHQA
jgi:hypothetical protein